MAAAKRPVRRPADEVPLLDPAAMNAAVELPEAVDPPQTLIIPVPADTETVERAVALDKRVRIVRSEQSVRAGGAHYTTKAGDIMVLPQAIADDMIAQRVAEEI